MVHLRHTVRKDKKDDDDNDTNHENYNDNEDDNDDEHNDDDDDDDVDIHVMSSYCLSSRISKWIRMERFRNGMFECT